MSAPSPIAIVVFPLSNDFVTKKKKDDLAAHLHPSLFPRHVYFSPSWKHAWPPSSLFGGLQAPQHLDGFASSVFHQWRKIRLRKTCTSTSMTEQLNKADTWNRRGLWTLNLWPSLALGVKNFIQVMHAAWLSTHLVMHAIQCDWPADQCRLSLTTN